MYTNLFFLDQYAILVSNDAEKKIELESSMDRWIHLPKESENANNLLMK